MGEKSNRPAEMTAADRAALDAAGKAYNNATTQEEKDAAHKAAQEVRAKYNYDGGTDGSQKIATNSTKSSTSKSSSGTVTAAASGNSGYTALGDWSGDQSQSQELQTALSKYGNAYNDAMARGDTAAAQEAHRKAEELRKLYGYSGGTDGSQNIKADSGYQALGDFSGDKNLTQELQDLLRQYGVDYNVAKVEGDQAGMDAAHLGAEQLRYDSDRYIGRTDGSVYTPESEMTAEDFAAINRVPSTQLPVQIPQEHPAQTNWGAAPAVQQGTSYAAPTVQQGTVYNTPTVQQGQVVAAPGMVQAPSMQQGQIVQAPNTVAAPGVVTPNAVVVPTVQNPNVQYYTGQAPDFTQQLNAWLQAAVQQQTQASDYAVNRGVQELQRAQEDAQSQYQTQQNQIDREAAKAQDNQALYAEARGDRGGIGQAQFNQIQAQAMQNRNTVNNARVKLSTDTARQVADLRAQGEFEKANALLALTQTYLSKLTELQQWGAEYNMSVAQFNQQISQWAQELVIQQQQYAHSSQVSQGQWAQEFLAQQRQYAHDSQVQQSQWNASFNAQQSQWAQDFQRQQEQFNHDSQVQQGQWNASFNAQQSQWAQDFQRQQEQFNYDSQVQQSQWGQQFQTQQDQWNAEFNQSTQQYQNDLLRESGLAALSVGIRPTAAQQAALGYTDDQVGGILAQYQVDQAVSKRSGGSGNSGGSTGNTISLTTARDMMEWGQFTTEAVNKMLESGYSEQYLKDKYGYTGQSITYRNDSETKNDYKGVSADLAELQSEGVNSATLNEVINRAWAQGMITDTQAKQLRTVYASGSR